MLEALHGVDILTQIRIRRAAIIDSVLQDGLKTSKQLQEKGEPFFGSFDHSPNDFISFRLMFPPTIQNSFPDSHPTLDEALYQRGVSVLPVMAERPGVRHNSDPVNLAYSFHDVPWAGEEEEERVRQVLESRISSSFLVVVNETMEELYRKSRRFLFSSAKERFEELENIGRLKESRISPDRFSYLVFPEEVFDEYKGKEEFLNEFKIKVIKSKIKRDLFQRKMKLTIPDYESALLEILEERKEPIWVHGVRLPNKEDVSH